MRLQFDTLIDRDEGLRLMAELRAMLAVRHDPAESHDTLGLRLEVPQ